MLRRFGAPALAAVVLAATVAPAGIISRTEVQSGDTLLGDIRLPGEIDEYDFQAPRGATVSLDIHDAAPTGWKASAGLTGANVASFLGFSGYSPTRVRSDELDASGTWRLLVSSRDDSTGGYRIKIAVAPKRTFTRPGTGDAAPEPFVFGAPADSGVSITLSAKGPGAPGFVSVTGPDGLPLAAGTPSTRGRTTTVGGIRTAVLGDHTLNFTVPAGTKSWTATIRVSPPRPPRGEVRDTRAEGTPPVADVAVVEVAQHPYVTIRDERGGPNDLILVGGAVPTAISVEPRRGGCGLAADPSEDPPVSYDFACQAGYFADIRDVVRSGGLVRSFTAAVRSPAGSGTCAVSNIEYDAADRQQSWTEVRTFDATGHTHTLEYEISWRRPDGTVIGYRVIHTAPGSAPRAYEYGPFRTR